MINLLPPAIKQQYAYGLRNNAMRRWAFGLIVAVAGLGVIATYGLLSMQRSINNYSSQVASAQASLQQQKLPQVEQQIKTITNDFKLVIQVLSKEVLFSKLLKQLATIVPNGVVLTGFDINQGTSGIEITASVHDSTTATQFQLNLQDPKNKIFSKADLVNITCQSKPQNPDYGCAAQYKVLLAPNNPYLFINTAGAKQP